MLEKVPDLGIQLEIPLKMPISDIFFFFFRHGPISGRLFLKDVLSIPYNHSENIGLEA